MGVAAGLKEEKWPDHVISTVSLVAISLPEFISATFLMLVFSVWLRWLPAASSINSDVSLFRQLKLLILPIVTVSLVLLGYVARMVRASVIESSRSQYARSAILKGLPPFLVNTRHILKNALLPSVTIIAMNIGWLFGGIIIVESVFGFPGPGKPRPVRHSAAGRSPHRGRRPPHGRRVSRPQSHRRHRLRASQPEDQVLTMMKPAPSPRDTACSGRNDHEIRPSRYGLRGELAAHLCRHDPRLCASRVALVSMIILVFWLFMSIIGPLIAPFNPTKQTWRRVPGPLPSAPLRHGPIRTGRVQQNRGWEAVPSSSSPPPPRFSASSSGTFVGLFSGYVGGPLDESS